MGTDDFDTLGVRRAFRAEVKRSTHATVLAAGFIAIFALPAWAGFDHLVEPEHATTFTGIRLGLEVPLIGLWLALFTRVGRRHPELIGLLMLTLIEVSIAFMISRLEEAYAPYTLGLSLAIYGSAFLLIWPWRYTAALVGLTWLAVGVAIATAPEPLSHQAIATVAFYLGTASLVGFVGQFFRQAIAFKEFSSRIDSSRSTTATSSSAASWSASAARIHSPVLRTGAPGTRRSPGSSSVPGGRRAAWRSSSATSTASRT